MQPDSVSPDADLIHKHLIHKHLPPSAAALRLWALDEVTALALPSLRPDVVFMRAEAAANSLDAIAGSLDILPTETELAAWLRALRPGGRLIVVVPRVQASRDLVQVLERAGYTRILVEEMDGGLLLRGEKPHTTDDTQARVLVALEREHAADGAYSPFDAAAYSGRYAFLLVRQTPNKPPWAIQPGEIVEWAAVALDMPNPVALTFSSLPRAVAFMQPTIHRVVGVSKIAKFTREAAAGWPFAAWLNPPVEALDAAPLTLLAVDPATAVTGDE